jgi:hypothetical protein
MRKFAYLKFITWMIALAFSIIAWGYVIIMFRELFSHSSYSY